MKKKDLFHRLMITITFLSCSANLTASGKFSLSSGVTYIEGGYGQDEKTRVVYIPFTAKYKYDQWTARLTIPYLVKSGPRNVIIGIGTIDERVEIQNTTESGLGDILASINYRVFYHPQSKILIDLKGKVKFGTADVDKSLGTGKTDFSIRTGIYKVFGNWTPYARVGYKFYGHNRLNNVVFASGGFSYKLSDVYSGGIDFSWRDRLVDNIAQYRQLTGHMTQKLDKNWKFQEYVIAGFGNRSPDWGLGVNINYAF